MAYSQQWLEDYNAIRGILVEATVYDVVAGQNTTMYLSNVNYITEDSLVSFNPIIIGGINITESLSLSGDASMSFGDIELSNPNGEFDSWLDNTKYIWTNRAVKVYLGDPMWASASITAVRSTFELVFSGIISDIDSSSRSSLNLKIRDKLEQLNTVITEHTIGEYPTWATGQSNQETIRPLIFGEVFNITPVLVNPAYLEYMFNDGAAELIIEIRDNGVPIYTHNGTSVTLNSTEPNLPMESTGLFRLSHPLVGDCTISAQGVKKSINLTTGAVVATYSNNIANLIAMISTQYGKTPLLTSELDLNNLSSFATSNTQSAGIYVSDKSNTLSVCQELARSIGAQVYMTRKGLLQLLRIGVPTIDAIVTITDNDILHHSLEISSKELVAPTTILGAAKCWTVQEGLVTGISDTAKESFSKEWRAKSNTANSTNTTIKALYNTSLPEQKDTLLIVEAEAVTEATRVSTFFQTPKIVYKFTGTAKLMSLKLGQGVLLEHNRFNLTPAKSGQVISLSPNWLSSTIDIEVLV